jgi:hypothetical protein
MIDPLNDFEENLMQRGRFAADRGVQARFYSKPIEDAEKSAEAGRVVCKDVVFVQILAPGLTNNTVERKATDEDKQRFRRQYESFRENGESTMEGTPLESVTWISRAQVEELAYMKIRTVEVLSAISDDVCGRAPGLYDLKRKAQAHMEKADKAAPFTEMARKNEVLEGQVQALQQQLEKLLEAQKETKK